MTFTWNYVGAEEGDFFQLRVADSEAAVVDQGVTTVAGRPRHTVKAAAGDAGLRAGRRVTQVGGRRRRARRSAARPPADRHPTHQGGTDTWEPPSSSAARSSPRAEDRPLTIGRVADVEIDDNPYLHRVFLQLHREHELWWL